MSQQGSARVGLLQVSAAGILWGTGGLALRLLREIVPMSVFTISAYRMLIAAVVLVCAVLLSRQVGQVVALIRRRPALAVAVGLSTAAYQTLYFTSVLLVGVTIATVISLGLAPMLLTVGESIRTRTRPGAGRIVVLAAALIGLVLVSGGAGTASAGSQAGLGVLAAVASGVVYAVATVLGRPLAQSFGPLALTTTTTTVGAIALVPLSLLTGVSGGPLGTTDPRAIALLVYLGVFTMALAYALLYAGLRTTSGSAAVIATLLEPVTAAVVAAIILGERVGVAGLIGTALILAAVAGLARRPPAALA